jgi:hypothetical protein
MMLLRGGPDVARDDANRAPRPPLAAQRYVATNDYRLAVQGHEAEILVALGIDPNSRWPIRCPYPHHEDKHASWRWYLMGAVAFCTCSQGDDIATVVMKIRGLDFEQAKLWILEILHRVDLIRTIGPRGALWFLNPLPDMCDASLPPAYLGSRLHLPPTEILMPTTPVAGWRELPYFDGDPKHPVGRYPTAIFGLINTARRLHAFRIYLAPGGQGKAKLPPREDGTRRDSKKAAPLPKDDKVSVAGCCVYWGDPARAHTIILGEGIETMQAVAQAHATEVDARTTAVMAAISASWMRQWKPWPATKFVIIVADRDEGPKHKDKGFMVGETAAEALAEKLVAEGLRVLLALPGEPGTDSDALDVWLAGGADVVRALVRTAKVWAPKPEPKPKPKPPPESRPLIRVIDPELPRVVNEVENALIAIGGIYERSGQLVRPIRMRVPAADDRQTTSQRLGLISAAHIAETATRAAKFEKYDARAQGWRPIACPSKIAETLLARLEWKLPLLAGIISAPMLRPNGSLLDKPGYDAHTCLIFDPGETVFPPIYTRPTIEQAKAELAILNDLLSEFSFAGEVDKAVAIAAILTVLVRRSLPSAPMFGITAPDFGCGKSYLADVVSAIGTGAICPVTAQGEQDQELDKHLVAVLRGGADLLCIDNISRPLRSDLLCQMLTQSMVRVRILGESIVLDLSTALTMLATGINLQIADDLVRRTLLCRLTADIERPETRQFKKRPLDATPTRPRNGLVTPPPCGLARLMHSPADSPRRAWPSPGELLRAARCWRWRRPGAAPPRSRPAGRQGLGR